MKLIFLGVSTVWRLLNIQVYVMIWPTGSAHAMSIKKMNLKKTHCKSCPISWWQIYKLCVSVSENLASIPCFIYSLPRTQTRTDHIRTRWHRPVQHAHLFRNVLSHTLTIFIISFLVLQKLCTLDATRRAAPHRPDGRRPIAIQSRFIRDTNLMAVIDTSCSLSPNSSLCANLGINSDGST